MMIPIISLELIVEIHDNVIDISGGVNGVDIGCLAGSLARVEQQVFYNNINDVFELACWYAVAIAKGRGFTDGNKRTALSTMLTFLDIQGITLVENSGLDDVMVSIVESQLPHDILVKKLSYYIRHLIKEN